MEAAEQLKVVETLLDHLANRTTADAGGIRRNPVDVYTCPELASLEQQRLFRETPLLMGLSGELPLPGTYWATDDSGVPLLLIRDTHGKFRAFLNVCRHRSAQVVPKGRGRSRQFHCPFHAWCYNTEGELTAVPREDRFGCIDKSAHGLTELPSLEHAGGLWVRPAPGAAIEADEVLGGLEDELGAWRLAEHAYAGEQCIEGRMNWKLAVDTFGENYHFEVLHRHTLANILYGNLQTSDVFGRNYRMVFAQKNIDKLDVERMAGSQIRGNRFRDYTTSVYFMFPNAVLVFDPNYVDLFRIYPHREDTTRSIIHQKSYIDPRNPPLDPRVADWNQRIEQVNSILCREDFALAESSQRGACSGAHTHVVFGRNEPALHHYHGTFRNALGLEPLPLETR